MIKIPVSFYTIRDVVCKGCGDCKELNSQCGMSSSIAQVLMEEFIILEDKFKEERKLWAKKDCKHEWEKGQTFLNTNVCKKCKKLEILK